MTYGAEPVRVRIRQRLLDFCKVPDSVQKSEVRRGGKFDLLDSDAGHVKANPHKDLGYLYVITTSKKVFHLARC